MPISKSDLTAARERISAHIYQTPVIQSEYFDRLTGARIFFKCENLQRIGAFKARGAFNACLQLSESERSKGVATHSSGNHAQALALAARELGMKAWIVMPSNSPWIKMQGVAELGAEIIECEANQESREAALADIVAKTGANFIPPYNHEHIIAGQSTAAQELIELHPELDFMLAPVGGGGLLSGTALAARYFSENTAVIGCEPDWANDAFRSFQTGKIESNDPAKVSIADGLRTKLGEITFPIIREHVKQIITVPEERIVPVMFEAWNRLKIIIEPSSAVTLAVLLDNAALFKGKKVGVIFSGGNADPGQWMKIPG